MKRLLLAPLLVALAGCSSLSPHIDEAISHFESGNYKDAFKSCEKAIEEDSKSPDAYFCRGMASLNLGKKRSAKKDFSKVISLDPKFGAAYYWRGRIDASCDVYGKWKRSGSAFIVRKGKKDIEKACSLGFVPPEDIYPLVNC